MAIEHFQGVMRQHLEPPWYKAHPEKCETVFGLDARRS
ncbi:hypothetical protein CES85_0211 [Ochrobactrum quorumnocens]|uniref:Uncharacterized protein n=1 Tax=Ochrobactrum quorumnocens TaxID=271865 RepID=A0A248UJC9_9HYPH|nr:hypothetical protein CES85_0211 [[Ochrobactrum] quorumnocens]